jgi:hypothetical protein
MRRYNTKIVQQRFNLRVHGHPDKTTPNVTTQFLQGQFVDGCSLGKVMGFGNVFDGAIEVVLPSVKSTNQHYATTTATRLQPVTTVLTHIVGSADLTCVGMGD